MTTCRTYSFTYAGVVPPSPRPRVAVRGKFPTVYMPSEYTAWQQATAQYIREDVLEEYTGNGPCLDGDVDVRLQVRIAKPKTSKLKYPKPDVDNYAKSVLDAVTKSEVVWDDDCQVVRLVVEKCWCFGDEEPGFTIDVTEREPFNA